MSEIKIASWNVNSVKARLPHLLSYLKDEAPEVLLLQETKTMDDGFPMMEIEELGYNILLNGQKTYNGVAVLSKFPLELVSKSLPGMDGDEQARYIEAIVSLKGSAIRVASVYVPNGQEVGSDKFQYKLKFFECLKNHTANLLEYGEQLFIGGDFNVANDDMDVYDPKGLEGTVCFHMEERRAIRRILNLGMYDSFRATFPEKHQYSWWHYRAGAWQYNKGMRIDYMLISPEAVDHLAKAGIDQDIRGQDKASDHVPVWCSVKV